MRFRHAKSASWLTLFEDAVYGSDKSREKYLQAAQDKLAKQLEARAKRAEELDRMGAKP